MAHAIDRSAGKDAMAYVGTEGTPWHGLGQPIQKGMSPREIVQAAGLGWRVNRSAVQFTVDGRKELGLDTTHQVLYRSDTKQVLDITGPGYVPHQNDDVMAFFQDYVEAGDMFIDTAGALNDGKMIWVLAKMGESFKLAGGDQVGGYVLLANPHQYGKGMIAKTTAIRVVCQNTLSAALQGGGVKIWHTREFNKARQDEAKEKLGIARERFHALKEDCSTLAKITMEKQSAMEVFALVTGNDPKDPLEDQPRTVQRLVELFMGAGKGAQLDSAKGTAWGALNAVTQWVDHEYGRSQNARLNNAWLGRGDVMKREAMQILLGNV